MVTHNIAKSGHKTAGTKERTHKLQGRSVKVKFGQPPETFRGTVLGYDTHTKEHTVKWDKRGHDNQSFKLRDPKIRERFTLLSCRPKKIAEGEFSSYRDAESMKPAKADVPMPKVPRSALEPGMRRDAH